MYCSHPYQRHGSPLGTKCANHTVRTYNTALDYETLGAPWVTTKEVPKVDTKVVPAIGMLQTPAQLMCQNGRATAKG